jgi:hypothetical protein
VDETPHILSRDEILRAELDAFGKPLLPTEQVPVPEWSGTVIVRGLTGSARDTFEGTLVKQRGRKVESNLENFRAKLLVQSIVDEQGNLMFTERDVQALGRKSAAALERVYSVAMRLSRLTPEDVEELTTELGEEQSGDSGSDSQDISEPEASLISSGM